jgi:hypothetical protein
MIIFCISTPDILSALRELASENASIPKEINDANAILLTILTLDEGRRVFYIIKIKERVKRKIYVKISNVETP